MSPSLKAGDGLAIMLEYISLLVCVWIYWIMISNNLFTKRAMKFSESSDWVCKEILSKGLMECETDTSYGDFVDQ